MAQIPDSTKLKQRSPPARAARPRLSFFLGCFGRSSGGVSKPEKAFYKGELNSKKKAEIQWFSWSRLKPRKSPKRTVPIDANEKVQKKNGSFGVSKSSKKFSFSRQLQPAKDVDKCRIPPPPVVAEKISNEKPDKTGYDDAQNIILGNCKSTNHLDSIKKTTCKKRVSSISKIKSKTSISCCNSSEVKFEVSRATAVLPHSVSMPPPTQKQLVNAPGGDSHVNEEEVSQGKNNGKCDQFFGLSIILVTLIIMIVSGKLCAILCTSAWLYFYPSVRAKKGPNDRLGNGPKSGGEIDVNSEEYKKKVVLEGFLERNHRKS